MLAAMHPARRATLWLALLPLLVGCASHRVLKLENRLLLQENGALHERVHALEGRLPAAGSWAKHPTLDDLERFLDDAGYRSTREPGSPTIRLDHAGVHRDFKVNIQLFEAARVVFLSTSDYLHLEVANNPESLVLLLVQMAALNYEMLVGKLQLNPESGEILLSVELPIADGLGRETLISALEQLTHAADSRYPELQKAASGLGL